MRLPRTRPRRAPKPGAGQCPSPKRRALGPVRALGMAAVLVGALGLALGLTLGLRGLASDQPTAAASLQPLLQTGGPLIVFSEFGEAADILWAANPNDPTERVQLGRVDHARGYGISPSLSPHGGRIAYVVLPPDLPLPSLDAPAELWVLETAGDEARRLAEGIDLLVTPVWTPSGDALVVRHSEWREGEGGSFQLLRIDLTGAAVPLATAQAGLFPIDFSPDGAWLYYAVLSAAGTDLARAPALAGGEAETVAHLSDGFTRDWHLSPDGARLAYLAEAPPDATVAFVARVLDLSTGQVGTPLADAAGVDQFNPVWERGGGLTIGRLGDASAGSAPVRLSADSDGAAAPTLPPPLPAAGTGFDVPLSWSPDGVHLAVRSFAGASVMSPGPSRVVVASTDGERRELSPLSDIVIAGWLEAPE